ncbi:MAG: substrate-binding domain-containing protein, partial [bacterium]
MGKTNIPGCRPNKVPALRVAVRRLINLGHRRIVMMVREERRKPTPGLSERAFIQELESNGIKTGSYNLPDWEDNVDDFHRCLNSLFKHTPPTALILDEMQHFS